MERLPRIVVVSLWLSLAVGLVLSPVVARATGPMMQVAETTFIRSLILVVDQPAKQLTVRTAEGRVMTLGVIDARLMSGLAKGDHVSFEIDTQERIVTLVKVMGIEAASSGRGG